MLRRIAARLGMVAVIMLLAGLFGATLVRLAPGFGHEINDLDYQLSAEYKQTQRQARGGEENIFVFYAQYLARLVQGDLGESRTFRRPVKELLVERLPATMTNIGMALFAAWLVALALAVTATMTRFEALDHVFGVTASVFLCVPAAVLGLIFVIAGGPPELAIALLVFPKIYRYATNLLRQSYELPHITTARAKGLSESQVLLWHVAPTAAPQLLAFAGVSVAVALSVALPVEVICDVPGIGQLAWSAAQQRDLTLLVNLTLFVAFVTSLSTAVSELFGQSFERRPA
jgi:peptide/nickel transport system permease protein